MEKRHQSAGGPGLEREGSFSLGEKDQCWKFDPDIGGLRAWGGDLPWNAGQQGRGGVACDRWSKLRDPRKLRSSWGGGPVFNVDLNLIG